MKMKLHPALLAAGVAAALLSTSARADIDAGCFATWRQVITNQAMGAKCKWMTPALETKLKAAESSSYACAAAKATDAEKTELAGAHVPAARKFVGESMNAMPCNDQAKKYFDEQNGKIK